MKLFRDCHCSPCPCLACVISDVLITIAAVALIAAALWMK